MPRHKTGCAILRTYKKAGKTVKLWYARVEDDSGKRIERQAPYNSESSARRLAVEILADLKDEAVMLDHATMTFAQLAEYYKRTFLTDAEYRDGIKVSGLRSRYTFEGRLKVLKDYFGSKRLRSITHGDLVRYKAHRLKTPAVLGQNTRGTNAKGKPHERERSIASVHRELSFLRRIFNVAASNGWIARNPFQRGEPLIRPADEKRRQKIVSKEEEELLLALCVGRKAHLRPIIVCALDTGLRAGELFTLRWSDVDWREGTISIHSLNTKTQRGRTIAMTDRVRQELLQLFKHRLADLVFGVRSCDGAFKRLVVKAGIPELRFHDLRHTYGTRLVQGGMPLPQVGKNMGHTQPQTTYRYVGSTQEAVSQAAGILNRLHKNFARRERRKR
jgi:integrase